MRRIQRILSIILAIITAIFTITITSSAETSGDWSYSVISETDKTAQITEYKGSKKEIEIPSSIDGYTITTIGEWAFYYCDKLTSIKIPDSVTLIDEWSFAYCKSLTSITIPEGVIIIGEHAFSYCENLEDITISNSVTIIGTSAFYYCYSLKEIEIPDGVISIGKEAFSACKNLITVKISASVTTIGELAFSSCENLTTITVDSDNQYFSTDEYGSVLFNKDKTSLITYLRKNPQTSYIIPDTVTTICNSAFACCKNLTSITIGENVETIGNSAFNYCTGLINLIIPDNVKTIGDWAFYDCFNLTSVKIGNGVTLIGKFAFALNDYFYPDEELQLNELTLGNCVTTIGEYAFWHCKLLTSVTIPDSVITIERGAFSDCVNIEDVYYSGSEEQWNEISIDNNNEPLTTATIHYNYHIHKYNSVVTLPTCTEQGYTTYTCECGDSYVDDYVDALGHNYTSEITTPATHITEGVETFTCTCGDSYTETIDKLVEHNHNAVATPPTCTEQGYTTYACECGDSYVDDYVDALGHTHTDAVEENYVAPTCTEAGSKDVVVYCSVCDEEISRETVTVEATGHEDTDNDGYCDDCNFQICNHRCHKSGFAGFIWKILRFVNRIFGTNKYCECGVAHY